jgi:hypothetical protein
MQALGVGNHPALGTVDENEIHRHRTAVIGEGGGDIGLVVLPAQDRYRDRT